VSFVDRNVDFSVNWVYDQPMSTTVRISNESRELLRRLAEESSMSQQAVLEHALERYRREKFLEGLHQDCLRGGSLSDVAENLSGTLDDGLKGH
jgi:hypothetical protein